MAMLTAQTTAYAEPQAIDHKCVRGAAPLPDEDCFDPHTVSDQDLEKYRLPPRPDALRCPVSYAHWLRALSRPVRFSTPDLVDPHIFPRDWRTSSTSSENWSGASISAEPGRRFVRVQGTWQVPSVLPPPPLTKGGPWIDGEYRSSTWIGLDGFEPSSPSLPQIGTAQEICVENGRILEESCKTYAWVQWWVREQDTQGLGPKVFNNIGISPGDLVSCELVVLKSRRVIARIKNETTGCCTSTPYSPEGPRSEYAEVEGLTASWVMERPTKIDSDELYTLPDYGSTVFYGCVAVIDDDIGIGSAEQQLEDAELIEMVDFDDLADPGAVVSRPMQQSNDSVAVFYRDNGP